MSEDKENLTMYLTENSAKSRLILLLATNLIAGPNHPSLYEI